MKKKLLLLVFVLCTIFMFNCHVNAADKSKTSNPTSCLSFVNDKYGCETNSKFACVWNDTKYGDYCNTDNLIYVSCGNAFDIPYQVPQIISFIVNLLKIATPIILIIIGMITLLKALASSKEDEIKKAKDSLIKKLIASALVFFVIAIVQFVILKVADDDEQSSITSCLDCFLNNDCKSTAYYKTNLVGTYYCTPLKGGKPDVCDEFKSLK